MNQKKKSNMEERGISTIIGSGLIIVILLVASSILISSIKSYNRNIRAARAKRNERTTDAIRTDIKIKNIEYRTSGDNIEIITKNTGSTPLDISSVYYILDGKMVSDEEIELQEVNGEKTGIWMPEKNLRTVIISVNELPSRGKQIAEQAISDYFTNDNIEVI